MSAEIKGWCPSAFRPMQSGDGLIARIRPNHCRLSPVQAVGLADLAEAYGNGVIELTSRANLQLRGIGDDAYMPLLGELDVLGLLDSSFEDESRRNLILSPFSDGSRNQETIADGLTAGLARTGMPILPAKFGFVIDTAVGVRHLADVSGDIRIEAGLGGLSVRADGASLGCAVTDEEDAVETALDMVQWFAASGGIGGDGRGRMRRHLEQGAVLPSRLTPNTKPAPTAPPIRPGLRGENLVIGAPFGLFGAEQLRLIGATTKKPIHITPFRLIILDDVEIEAFSNNPGLITEPDDPLLRVFGCTGKPACPQAKIETRDLARNLAPLIPAGQSLHVSGCAKGCAHPGTADYTIVGEEDGHALIENGKASDSALRTNLDRAGLINLLGEC